MNIVRTNLRVGNPKLEKGVKEDPKGFNELYVNNSEKIITITAEGNGKETSKASRDDLSDTSRE